mmetsp:Transcript_41807/g.91221  ORF Transcript_41807/g.91221 Transcript_41807/m.91221 type:complete len:438 (+) Transcript_41807:803-2116(+)
MPIARRQVQWGELEGRNHLGVRPAVEESAGSRRVAEEGRAMQKLPEHQLVASLDFHLQTQHIAGLRQDIQVGGRERCPQSHVADGRLPVPAAQTRSEEGLGQETPDRGIEAPKKVIWRAGGTNLPLECLQGDLAVDRVCNAMPDGELIIFVAGSGAIGRHSLEGLSDRDKILRSEGLPHCILLRQHPTHGAMRVHKLKAAAKQLQSGDLKEAPETQEGAHLLIQNHDGASGLRQGCVEGPVLWRAAHLLGSAVLVEGQEAEPERDVLGPRLAAALVLLCGPEPECLHGVCEGVAPPVRHKVIHQEPLRVHELRVGHLVTRLRQLGGCSHLLRDQPRVKAGSRQWPDHELVQCIEVGLEVAHPALRYVGGMLAVIVIALHLEPATLDEGLVKVLQLSKRDAPTSIWDHSGSPHGIWGTNEQALEQFFKLRPGQLALAP